MKRFTFFSVAVLLMFTALAVGLNPPRTHAQSAAASMIVIERDSGRVLYGHNSEARRPMASTTKIVTAITVIDHTPNLDIEVRVPKAAVGVEGSSIYLSADEPLTVRDLLHGLMLQSGNDCAAALAILTAGDEVRFAALMNETAKKAGAEHSNFVNPHGLHHDAHYTTAHDLARITAYALKNPIFREIVATKRYTMPWAGREYERVIKNKNKLLFTFEGADGVKTGYTKKAGRCLVSSATRAGMTVVAVVLNCGPMFEECAALMTRAFENYCNYDLADAAITSVSVDGGRAPSVELKPNDPCVYPLTLGELNKIEYRFHEVTSFDAPPENGVKNGKVEIVLQNQLLFCADLYTITS